MPNINVSLAGVKAYDNMPVGEYLGQIDSITYQAPADATKNESLRVQYVSIDGETIGRKSSQWLYFTEKAIFRTKKFFDKFGQGDIDLVDESFDPETDELIEPDLVGTQVIFKVYADKPRPGSDEPSYKTALVSVVDDEIPAPKAKAAKAEPTEEAVDPKEAKRAALAAQLAALDEDSDDEGDDEPEEKKQPVKARTAPKTVAAAPKRQLR